MDWRPIVELIRGARKIALTSHQRPDCDALGSEIGLAVALKALGKETLIANADPTPPHIEFIDPERRVHVLGVDVTVAEIQACDVHLIVDTSAWQQLGPMAEVFRASPAKKGIIDHHASGDDLGAVVAKEVEAEATGRLVLELIEDLGVRLTPAMATPLYYAIATDTGWFRFPSVTERTFIAAGKLVAAGAVPSEVFRNLYDQNTLARVQLHGRILTTIALHESGRVATAAARQADFAATGAIVSDTEDVVNRLLSISGVEVAMLFVEMPDGLTKVSLRSRGSQDLHRLAERFGGGGHAKAAGVRMKGSVDEATATLLAALREDL